MTSIVSSRRLGSDDRRISSSEQERTKTDQRKNQSSAYDNKSSNPSADANQQEESLDDRISNVQQRIMMEMFGDEDSFDDDDFQVMVPKANRGEFVPATSRFLRQQHHHKSFNDTCHIYTDEDSPSRPGGRSCAPKSRKVADGLGTLEQIMAKVKEHDDEETGNNGHNLVLDKLMARSLVSSSKTPASKQTSILANVEDIIRQQRNGNMNKNESNTSSLKTSGSPDALNRSGHSLGGDDDALHGSASSSKSPSLLATDRRPNSSRSSNSMLAKAGLSPKRSKTPMGRSPQRSRPGPTGHSPPRSRLASMGYSPPRSRPSSVTQPSSVTALSPTSARRMMRLQERQKSQEENPMITGTQGHLLSLPVSSSSLITEDIGSSGNLSGVSIPRSGSSGQLSSSSGHKSTSGGRGALRRRRRTQPEEDASGQADMRSHRQSSLSLSSHGTSRRVKAQTLSMYNDEERISASAVSTAQQTPPPQSSHRRTPPPPSGMRSSPHARRPVSRQSSSELTEDDDAEAAPHGSRTPPSSGSRRARRQQSTEHPPMAASSNQHLDRPTKSSQEHTTPPASSRHMGHFTKSSSEHSLQEEATALSSRRAIRRSSIGPMTPESTTPSCTPGNHHSTFEHNDDATPASCRQMNRLSDHSLPGESSRSSSRRVNRRSSIGHMAPESTTPSSTPGFSSHASLEHNDDTPSASSRQMNRFSDLSYPGESAPSSSSRRVNRRSSIGYIAPESTTPSSTPAVSRHSSFENSDDTPLASRRHADPLTKSSSEHSFQEEAAPLSGRRANRRSSMGHTTPECTAPSSTPAVSRHSSLQHNDDTPADTGRPDSVEGTWDIPLAQSGRRRGSRNDPLSASAHSASDQCSRSTNPGRRPTRRTDALSSSLHGTTPRRSRSTNPGRRSSTRAFDSSSHSSHHQRSRSTNASRRTTTRGGTRRSRDIPLDSSRHSENSGMPCTSECSTNHVTALMDPPANATTTNGQPGQRRSVDATVDARPQSMATLDAAVVGADLQRRMSSSSLSNDRRDDEPMVEHHQPFSESDDIGQEESEDEGVVLSRNLRQIAAIEHKPSSVRRLRPRVDGSSHHRSKSCDRRRSQRPRPPTNSLKDQV